MPYIQGVSSLFSINPYAPVKAGDTIYLRSGLHEKLIISGAYNAKTVTITTEQGHQPVLSTVQILGGSRWKLTNLTAST